MESNPFIFGAFLAAVGMGAVFFALVLLATFTSLFNRFFSSRTAAAPTTNPIPVAMDAQPPAPDGAERLRRKAAAIAVAVVLTMQQNRRPLFQPDLTKDNAWRAVNRSRRITGEVSRAR